MTAGRHSRRNSDARRAKVASQSRALAGANDGNLPSTSHIESLCSSPADADKAPGSKSILLLYTLLLAVAVLSVWVAGADIAYARWDASRDSATRSAIGGGITSVLTLVSLKILEPRLPLIWRWLFLPSTRVGVSVLAVIAVVSSTLGLATHWWAPSPEYLPKRVVVTATHEGGDPIVTRRDVSTTHLVAQPFPYSGFMKGETPPLSLRISIEGRSAHQEPLVYTWRVSPDGNALKSKPHDAEALVIVTRPDPTVIANVELVAEGRTLFCPDTATTAIVAKIDMEK